MKKILGLTIAALLIMGIVGGGTWAYFSDTETSLDNTWNAGTLNLLAEIAGTAVGTDVIVTEGEWGANDKVQFGTVTPIVPGDSGTITWTLTNTGSVNGTLTLVAATTFNEGALTEPEAVAQGGVYPDPGTEVGLDTAIMVWVTCDGVDILGTTSVYVAMSGLAAALNLEVDETMDAGIVIVYVLHWEVPTTVGNEIQGDTAELDITFTLDQVV